MDPGTAMDHRLMSPEVRYIGGERDSGRVPQRGGEDGDWIDVRPRRRKALRQVPLGQDKFQEGKRLRNGARLQLRHERVRYSSRGDCYDGDFDTSTVFFDSRPVWMDDRDGVYEAALARNRRLGGVRSGTARRTRRSGSAMHAAGVQRQQQREPLHRQPASESERTEAAGSDRIMEGLHRKQPRGYAGRNSRCGTDRTVDEATRQLQQPREEEYVGSVVGSTLKRYVTFYITHFPPQASIFILRKGFEVCGILEDVFVANTRNRNSEVYGFVRYAKVRDVGKLLKAVNNVCFGQYCVRAVLARFDRKGVRRGVEMKSAVVDGENTKGGGRREGEDVGVRVGSILVRVGDRKSPGKTMTAVRRWLLVREGRRLDLRARTSRQCTRGWYESIIPARRILHGRHEV